MMSGSSNQTPSALLIEIQYLPPIAYFAMLSSFDEVTIEKHENYVKQSYRNRCQVVTAQGLADLIIPMTGKHGKVAINEIRIDHGQKWLNNHWRTIQSSYGNAPFFEHYSDELHDQLFKKHEFLYDLNMDLLSMCLGWLKKSMTVNESLTYEKSVDRRILDARSLISVKNAQNAYQHYQPISYTQVFGNAFVENVSIIDLIFCVGPDAAGIVKASVVGK